MARRYRSVLPGHPHHVIQRGNRRQKVFFRDDDYRLYLRLLREQCDRYGTKIWAYCLMSNHIHLVVVPSEWESLAKAVGETHKAYTRMTNKREKWRGYLWQGRFASFTLHEAYYWTVMRYVELNPVRAGMVKGATDYPCSSARAHVKGGKDIVLDEAPLLPGWGEILKQELSSHELCAIRRSCSSGRPLGDETFVGMIEKMLGISWTLKKRGPKSKRQLDEVKKG
jgi:putative transposase